jgi:hypothetical protein
MTQQLGYDVSKSQAAPVVPIAAVVAISLEAASMALPLGVAIAGCLWS